MDALPGNTTPAALFKYVSVETGLKILRGTVRFTQPGALNDVFELQPVISLGVEDVEDAAGGISREEWDRHYKKIQRTERRDGRRVSLSDIARTTKVNRPEVVRHAAAALKNQEAEIRGEVAAALGRYGVFSLTEDPVNILMWAHYATRHQGLVIQFDPDHSWFSSGRTAELPCGYLGTVQYMTRRPALGASPTHLQLFLVKSDDWAYEREWRIIRPLEQAQEVLTTVDEPPLHLFSLDKGAIASVILGCRILPAAEQAVRELLDSDAGLRHVAIKRSVQHDERFAVTVVP